MHQVKQPSMQSLLLRAEVLVVTQCRTLVPGLVASSMGKRTIRNMLLVWFSKDWWATSDSG